jgi:hypothetical protein
MTAEPMPFEQARVASSFLAWMFGTKPDDLWVVLFRLNPARSVSFTGIARRPPTRRDRPTCMCTSGCPADPSVAVTAHKPPRSTAWAALWADIDIAHPVHKKPGLPPDQDARYRRRRGDGAGARLVIHSGHGLQAWWPLAEVWSFDSMTGSGGPAKRIWRGPGRLTLKERARALGYTVDMVSDLARVLRVPGTRNAKDPDDVAPVEIIRQSKATISEDDVLSILLDGTYEQAEREIDGRQRSGDARSSTVT